MIVHFVSLLEPVVALVVDEILDAGFISEDTLIDFPHVFYFLVGQHFEHFLAQHFEINIIHSIFLLLPQQVIVINIDGRKLGQTFNLSFFESI